MTTYKLAIQHGCHLQSGTYWRHCVLCMIDKGSTTNIIWWIFYSSQSWSRIASSYRAPVVWPLRTLLPRRWTFRWRSLNVRREPMRERLACVATIASVNTFRLANIRARELYERSPDARERHLDVSRTFPDARLADVSELLNFTYAFKCNYHQKCKLASL